MTGNGLMKRRSKKLVSEEVSKLPVEINNKLLYKWLSTRLPIGERSVMNCNESLGWTAANHSVDHWRTSQVWILLLLEHSNRCSNTKALRVIAVAHMCSGGARSGVCALKRKAVRRVSCDLCIRLSAVSRLQTGTTTRRTAVRRGIKLPAVDKRWRMVSNGEQWDRMRGYREEREAER